MDIAVLGCGYVGVTVGTGFAVKGHNVTLIDVNEDVVNCVNEDELPLHDDTLEEPFSEAVSKNRIEASNSYQAITGKDIVIIAVPTPSKNDGSIDLKYIKKSAREIGKNLHRTSKPLIVVKSTVLPGTTRDVVLPIIEQESELNVGEDFGICMNPEFLREGKAYPDFTEPDRIVIGEYDEQSGERLNKLYDGFPAPVLRTEIEAAEMIKYAANSLLATKISFANEIGNLCKELGIDSYEVMDAVGLDHRINRKFLNSGIGYGGSCFPKDVKALINMMQDHERKSDILESVERVNEIQKVECIELAEAEVDSLEGKDVGVLGLSFKPGTDDIRNSPAIDVIGELLERNCNVHAHDPQAIDNMREVYSNIDYRFDPSEVIELSDIVFLITDWPQYENLEREVEISDVKLIEGRRVLGPNKKNVEGLCW